MYNPSLAVDVLAQLRNDFPDVTLTMVGRDKGDGSLQEMWKRATSLRVSDRITVMGGVPKAEVPRCLSQGDIFLNTTNVDNMPTSVLEAMACGLCVVSTNAGGLPYLLEHETDALLVAPNDAEAMTAAVRRILLSPALATHLSTQARSKVLALDWSVIAPQWEKLLSSLGTDNSRNHKATTSSTGLRRVDAIDQG
jgi:glycosyltransferase involved in cell wall biosynthesis